MRSSYRNIIVLAAAAACLTLMPGCDRRTPEERLTTAFEFYQQGDALSAEMEALKVVEKAPEDPAAVQANALLAQIYANQNRYDEAEVQLQSALENVSQLDPMGKEVLRLYLSLLNAQEKYDEALKVVEKYQTEYADDAGTSLSLMVAEADIQTQSGQTTAARATLSQLIDVTTEPAEMSLYRDLYLRTFMQDEDTTAAIEYIESQLPQLERPEDRRSALIGLASLYGAGGDYQQSRKYLEQATTLFMESITQEVDRRAKTGMALQLGQAYLNLGNLPGGRRVFQTVYESNVSDPQLAVATVNGLSQNLLRMGETSATEDLLKDAAAKYPQAPFQQQLQQLQEIVGKGQLEAMAPLDTSTLTMKYREDNNVLWPAELPQALGVETTDTVSVITGTTGTAAGEVAPMDNAATATLESLVPEETTATAEAVVTTGTAETAVTTGAM